MKPLVTETRKDDSSTKFTLLLKRPIIPQPLPSINNDKLPSKNIAKPIADATRSAQDSNSAVADVLDDFNDSLFEDSAFLASVDQIVVQATQMPKKSQITTRLSTNTSKFDASNVPRIVENIDCKKG